jgi:hypothetical protein
MDFYAIGAQVIPVFYLALAFENHALYRQPDSYDPENKDNPRHWNASQIVLVVFATVIMAAGEVAALVGLYFELKHPIINMLVWYGLGAGIVAVVWPVLSYQSQLYKLHRAAGGGSGLIVGISIVALIIMSAALATLFFWVP